MPGIGAADHLYNNPIGQCTETRYICSAQITPPTRTLLDVSPRFSSDRMLGLLCVPIAGTPSTSSRAGSQVLRMVMHGSGTRCKDSRRAWCGEPRASGCAQAACTVRGDGSYAP